MKRITPILFLILTLMFACKQKPAQEQSSPEMEAVKAMFAKLPSPLEVAARIQATGAEFNPAILSSASNASIIASDTNKNKVAANLGIYMADLGYCIAYRQPEDGKQYYNAASQLAESLGLSHDFLSYLLKRYDDNLQNNDSVKAVLNDLYSNSVNEIAGEDASTLKGIVACANYIESLHTLMALIETFPKDHLNDDARKVILAPVFRLVLNQKENVNNVHNYLNSVGQNAPNIAYYNDAFNGLTEGFNNLQIEDKIANNQLEELLNDKVIQDLIFRVDNIRNEILKTSAM